LKRLPSEETRERLLSTVRMKETLRMPYKKLLSRRHLFLSTAT